MAWLFGDSYDHYTTAQITRKWSVETTTSFLSGHENTGFRGTIVSGAGRCNSAALRVKHVEFSNLIAAGPTIYLAPSTAGGVCGFAAKVSLFQQPVDLVRIMSNGVEYEFCQLRVLVEQDGSLQIIRSANAFSHGAGFTGGPNSYRALRPREATDILDTSSVAIQKGIWYYFELVWTIHASTGSAELFINGESVASASGIALDPVGSGGWNSFSLGRLQQYNDSSANAANQIDFDDTYVIDTSGSYNNSRLGDIRAEALFPIVDAIQPGTHQEWTPSVGSDHGAVVDDTTPNDDTDYNAASTAGLTDTYHYPDVTAAVGTVLAVQVLPCAKKTDSSMKTIGTVVRSGGSDFVGPARSVSTESYNYQRQVYETNPETAAPFTVTNLNAAEFGVEVIS